MFTLMERMPRFATIITKYICLIVIIVIIVIIVVSHRYILAICWYFVIFISFIIMALEPNIWGPHYWFVLHTIALTYPHTPNEVMRKKYYDLVQNLPLFLPVEEIGNTFSQYLDKYPVTPYLESRTSFVKWMHFIHNKINVSLGKKELTMEEAMAAYYEHYKPKAVKNDDERKRREKMVFAGVLFAILILGVALYRR